MGQMYLFIFLTQKVCIFIYIYKMVSIDVFNLYHTQYICLYVIIRTKIPVNRVEEENRNIMPQWPNQLAIHVWTTTTTNSVLQGYLILVWELFNFLTFYQFVFGFEFFSFTYKNLLHCAPSVKTCHNNSPGLSFFLFYSPLLLAARQLSYHPGLQPWVHLWLSLFLPCV